MNYTEAINYIHSTERFGSIPGLDTIRELMNLLGNPQDDLKVIHVAGTNGKGSICTMLAGILCESGLKTGLYTSPFLERFNERIKIDGKDISDDDIARHMSTVREKAEEMVRSGKAHPTEFELITAMAFLYYREMETDVVVLEVGMGGRLDATNIVKKPVLEIMASIGLDHTEYLGDTIEQIAWEKAGIIKPGTSVVCYPSPKEALDVFSDICLKRGCTMCVADENDVKLLSADLYGMVLEGGIDDKIKVDGFRLGLIGRHQTRNVITVLYAVNELIRQGYSEINAEHVKTALENVSFPGRFEVLSRDPVIIIDGGHNLDGITSFAENIRLCFGDRKINLFYGMLRDKDYMHSIDLLLPLAKSIYTLKPESPRALSAEELAEIIRKKNPDIPVKACVDYDEIFSYIQEGEINAFTGSLYMIGKIRTIIKNS